MSAIWALFQFNLRDLISLRSCALFSALGAFGALSALSMIDGEAQSRVAFARSAAGIGMVITAALMGASVASRDREAGLRNSVFAVPIRWTLYFLGVGMSTALAAFLVWSLAFLTALVVFFIAGDRVGLSDFVTRRVVHAVDTSGSDGPPWSLTHTQPLYSFALEEDSGADVLEIHGERRTHIEKLTRLMSVEVEFSRGQVRKSVSLERFHPLGPIRVDIPESIKRGKDSIQAQISMTGELMEVYAGEESVVLLEPRPAGDALLVMIEQGFLLLIAGGAIALLATALAQVLPFVLAGSLTACLVLVSLAHPFLCELLDRGVFERAVTDPTAIEDDGHSHGTQLVFDSVMVNFVRSSVQLLVIACPDLTVLCLGPRRVNSHGHLWLQAFPHLLQTIALAGISLIIGYVSARRDLACGS